MTDDSLIDKQTITSLQEIIEDGIFEIISDYRDQTRVLLNQLNTADKNNDTENIIYLAHTIKGSSGSLGLSKMLQLTQTLETSLRENNNIDRSHLISEINNAFQQTLDELISYKYLNQ